MTVATVIAGQVKHIRTTVVRLLLLLLGLTTVFISLARANKTVEQPYIVICHMCRFWVRSASGSLPAELHPEALLPPRPALRGDDVVDPLLEKGRHALDDGQGLNVPGVGVRV